MTSTPIANDALYATPEFVGYSLWLVPDARVEKHLHVVIQELAEELNTPPFRPHATLLGAIVGMEEGDVKTQTKRIADRLRAIDAEISEVSSKDLLYFQCVFGLLHLSQELRDAHRFAMEVFGRSDEPEFMPHISLVYGDLPLATRRALALKLSQPHETRQNLSGLRMKMEKLQVWNTTGPVKNWSMVAEFPLTSSEN